MIKLYKSAEINREKWNFCINHSHSPLIYAQSWYLDQISENWMALVEDDYEAVFPLCFKKRFGFRKINQPNFVQQLGLFSQKQISKDDFKAFLNQIPKTFFKSFVNCNYSNNPFLNDFKSTKRGNFILKLLPTYPELYKSYTENHRRNIKKAIQNQVNVVENQLSVAEVVAFYVENVADVLKSISKKEIQNFQQVCQTAIEKQKCFTLSVEKENKTLCAAIFFIHKNRITYAMGAANEAGKKIGSNHFLLDYVIKKHAQTDFLLDFEGSSLDTLARFYAGFGAINQPYLRLELD